MLVLSSDSLDIFQDDVDLLWCPPTISILEEPPTALEFLRQFVSCSRPCLIRNAIPAVSTENDDGDDDNEHQHHQHHHHHHHRPLFLTLDDIINHANTESLKDTTKINVSETVITVDVTPDGHGDCVRSVLSGNAHDDTSKGADTSPTMKRVFVKPYEQKMTLLEFQQRLRNNHQHDHRRNDEASTLQHSSLSDRMVDVNGLPFHQEANQVHVQASSIPLPKIPSDSVVYYSRQVSYGKCISIFPCFSSSSSTSSSSHLS